MKRAGNVFLGLMLVFATAGTGFAQAPEGARQGAGQGRQGAGQGRQGGGGRGPAAPACTTLACDVQQDWDRLKEQIINAADAMPEDKWDFKPTPAQQSFGERVMHIVMTDVRLLGTLGGKTPAPMIKADAKTKADVMAALRQNYDYGTALLKEFNDQQLAERVQSLPFLGPTTSRNRVIYFDIAHTQDIYGQLVVYLRLNGVTPPASRRGGV
jgi:uncharacterized damage-inducible protein DinB